MLEQQFIIELIDFIYVSLSFVLFLLSFIAGRLTAPR